MFVVVDLIQVNTGAGVTPEAVLQRRRDVAPGHRLWNTTQPALEPPWSDGARSNTYKTHHLERIAQTNEEERPHRLGDIVLVVDYGENVQASSNLTARRLLSLSYSLFSSDSYIPDILSSHQYTLLSLLPVITMSNRHWRIQGGNPAMPPQSPGRGATCHLPPPPKAPQNFFFEGEFRSI